MQTWQPYSGDAFIRAVPVLPWTAGPFGLTTDNGSDTLTAFDPELGTRLGQVHLGRDPVATDGPHHLVVDRAHNAVYVALAYPAPAVAPGPHVSHGSSMRNGYVQRLNLGTLRVEQERRIEANPGDIALSADGKWLATTHFDVAQATQVAPIAARRGYLTVLDTTQLDHPGALQLVSVCVLPHGLVLAPDGTRAWVACYGEDAIAVVDLSGPVAAVTRVQVGPNAVDVATPSYGPYALAAAPGGLKLAIGTTESKELRLFDATANAMLQQVWAQPGAGAVYFATWSADASQLWVPTQGPDALYLVDATTGKTLLSRKFTSSECLKPHEAQRTQAGKIIVVCEGDHAAAGWLLAVDPVTLATLWQTQTGVYPDRAALAQGM